MGASYPLPPVPRHRPIGVTILAVLTILAGIIFLLIGVVIIAFSVVAAALFSSFIGGLGAIAGAILLVVGIIVLVAGFGLLRLRMWAWWLAMIAFAITAALIGNRKLPAGVPVIGLGIAYALAFQISVPDLIKASGMHLPQITVPSPGEVAQGFLLLALPQIPLSLGNSILGLNGGLDRCRGCFG